MNCPFKQTCLHSKQLCVCGHSSPHFFHFPLPTNYKVNSASSPFSHCELLTLHILWCIEPGRSELFLGLTQLKPTQQLRRFSLWFGVCWPAAEVNAGGDYFMCRDGRESRESAETTWEVVSWLVSWGAELVLQKKRWLYGTHCHQYWLYSCKLTLGKKVYTFPPELEPFGPITFGKSSRDTVILSPFKSAGRWTRSWPARLEEVSGAHTLRAAQQRRSGYFQPLEVELGLRKSTGQISEEWTWFHLQWCINI